MNQCVPSWDLDDISNIKFHINHPNSTQDVPSLDYEVAELTWENGQLAMHALAVPRVLNKPTASSSITTWDKPRAGGTLESIVNQATLPPNPAAGDIHARDLVPWFEHHRATANPGGSASVTVTMDALVPCTRMLENQEQSAHVAAMGCSTRVGSCSAAAAPVDGGAVGQRVVCVGCRTNGSVSLSESATCGGRQVTLDTWERGLGGRGLTSPEYTISGQDYTAADDRDSISHHSRSQASDRKPDDEEGQRRDNGKSSVSTKRSRAAAIHNQSERKRRDKINQRMKTLQKLVPNSSKSDKASMLDEVIEYLKQLQAQVHVMSRMNMPSMMLPLAMQQQQQQQLQMSMMGMGMGVMDMNTIPFPAPAPAPFSPGDCSVMPDPLAALLASCQSQPMTMDAYSRLAAMYQQLQHQPAAGSKT